MNKLANLGLIPSRMTRLLCNQPVRGLRDLIDWSNTGKSSAANITPWVELQVELREAPASPLPAVAEPEVPVDTKVVVNDVLPPQVVEEIVSIQKTEPVAETLVASPNTKEPEGASAPVVEEEPESVEVGPEFTELVDASKIEAEEKVGIPATNPVTETVASVEPTAPARAESKVIEKNLIETVAASTEKPDEEPEKPLASQAKKSDVAESVEKVVPDKQVPMDIRKVVPETHVEEPKIAKPGRPVLSAEAKAAPPVPSASRFQSSSQPLPPLPSSRAAAPSGSESDYLMQLERLVVQLNYELGMKQMQNSNEGPEQWMVQRMIELNLRNLELQDQLASAMRTSQASGTK